MKKQKQPPVVTSQKVFFYNVFILRLWLKSSEDRIRVFSSWSFLHRYFSTILIMVTVHLHWRKILCGCIRSLWLWLLIAIMKRCAERCTLQLYHTSLSYYPFHKIPVTGGGGGGGCSIKTHQCGHLQKTFFYIV